MNFPKCIFCEETLSASTKPEHILQAALGGRKTTTRVVCSGCNGKFGEGIDNKLAEQVAVIRNLLQMSSGAGKPAPTLRIEDASGERLSIKGDGSIRRVVKPFTITELSDGRANVNIDACSMEEIHAHIPNIAAALKIPEAELKKQLVDNGQMSVTRRRPDTIPFSLSFGGEEAIRAAAKSCLVLWATIVGNDEVKSEYYADVRRYIVGGDTSFNKLMVHLDSRMLPSVKDIKRRFGPIFNMIYVCSNDDGKVIGHFTMYNMIAFQVVLAQAGGSKRRRVALVSNPLLNAAWSDKFADTLHVPFDWLESPEYTDFARERVIAIVKHYFDTMNPREIGRICDDVFSNYGLGDGDNIPVELREKIFAELSGRVAKHMLGLPHVEKLTAHQMRELFTPPDPKHGEPSTA